MDTPKSVAELIAAYPTLVSDLKNSLMTEIKSEADYKDKERQITVLTEENKDLKEQNKEIQPLKDKITELENSVKTLNQEKQTLANEVDTFKTAKTLAEFKTKVDAELLSSELDSKLISDHWKSKLYAMKTIEEVKAEIEDRKNLVSGITPVISSGTSKSEKNENSEVKKISEMKDEEIALSLVG